LNSRVYLTIGKLYGIPTVSYVDVVNGKAEIGFNTLELAARNIPIEFQLE